MISCNLQGGLVNQLFQIFATISLSIDNDIVAKIWNNWFTNPPCKLQEIIIILIYIKLIYKFNIN